MTKAQLMQIHLGSKVADKKGQIYEVIQINPYWEGMRLSNQLSKPDGYSLLVIKDGDWKNRIYFRSKELKVVNV